MDNREAVETLRERNETKAVDLLFRYMPQMQPSVLKHEFLASVANAMRNKVAMRRDKDRPGVGYSIGWANKYRTLPLLLVYDLDSEPPTVRHAFVPSPNDQKESKMLQILQQDEDEFARRFDLPTRNLAWQITTYGRGKVNRTGLSPLFTSPEHLTMPALTTLDKSVWYETEHLPSEYEVDHRGVPNLDDPRDRDHLEGNVQVSVDFNLESPSASVTTAEIRADKQTRTTRLTSIDFEFPDPGDVELTLD